MVMLLLCGLKPIEWSLTTLCSITRHSAGTEMPVLGLFRFNDIHGRVIALWY